MSQQTQTMLPEAQHHYVLDQTLGMALRPKKGKKERRFLNDTQYFSFVVWDAGKR